MKNILLLGLAMKQTHNTTIIEVETTVAIAITKLSFIEERPYKCASMLEFL
jgi:hypothetical protein